MTEPYYVIKYDDDNDNTYNFENGHPCCLYEATRYATYEEAEQQVEGLVGVKCIEKITEEPYSDTEILEFLLNRFKSYCFNYDFKGGSYGYTNSKSKWVFMDKAFQQKEGQKLKDVVITAMREENKIQEFKKQLEKEFND